MKTPKEPDGKGKKKERTKQAKPPGCGQAAGCGSQDQVVEMVNQKSRKKRRKPAGLRRADAPSYDESFFADQRFIVWWAKYGDAIWETLPHFHYVLGIHAPEDLPKQTKSETEKYRAKSLKVLASLARRAIQMLDAEFFQGLANLFVAVRRAKDGGAHDLVALLVLTAHREVAEELHRQFNNEHFGDCPSEQLAERINRTSEAGLEPRLPTIPEVLAKYATYPQSRFKRVLSERHLRGILNDYGLECAKAKRGRPKA
jgi:hypothetical protein